jgi:peptidoglycan/LPS O-acetylase OafA/YrhL
MSQNKFLHIEGLRAIAVILVIIYHSGLEVFNGGFIGVDVFLVISGFLMSYTVYNGNKPFKILTFYSKRLMRLYPHLAFMIVSVSVFTYFILPPYLLTESAQSAVSALLSVSNLYFLLQADYFGSESLSRPFIHTWSLGLEVQFYIIFGLIVGFAEKRVAGFLLLFLTLSSFMLNVITVVDNQPSSYFLLPSRFWEFGVGSLLFFIPTITGYFALQTVKFFTFLSIISLFFSAYTFNSALAFPGYYALIPVISTSFLILFSPQLPMLNNALKYKWLVFLGGISYGLYLWHQPIFALIRVHYTNEPPLYALIGSVGLSILISFILKRIIEDRCRRYKFLEPRMLIAMSITFLSILSFGYLSTITSGFKGRLDDFAESNSYYYDVNKEKDSGIEILHSTKMSLDYHQPFTENSEKKKILFIGDSMANDISASLSHFGQQFDSRFDVKLYRIETNCFYFSIYTEACQLMLNNSFEIIDKLSPDYIVVSALWKKGADFGTLSGYFGQLKNNQNIPVIVMGSTGFNDVFSLAYEVASLTGDEIDDDFVSSLTYKHRRSKFEYGNREIKKISASLGIHFWDRKKTFCNDTLMTCTVLRSNRSPYIWDNAHLTSSGMEKTFRYFNDNFSEIFNVMWSDIK